MLFMVPATLKTLACMMGNKERGRMLTWPNLATQ